MKTINISRAAIVGVFIFIGAILLVVAIFAVGNQQKSFAKSITIRAIFDDIEGLQEGNNVWLYGVKIGTIKKISFYGSDEVEVVMNIEKSAQAHIPKDAHVKISTDGLIGNKIIIVYGGTFTQTVDDNDLLASNKAVGSDAILATLQASNANILQITNDLRQVADTIKEGKGTLGKLIVDPSLADRLNATIKNFEVVSASSESAIARLDNFTAGLNKKGTLANELVTDTAVFANLIQTSDQLRNASVNIEGLSQNLQTASVGLTKDNTPIGMLFNNQKVAGDLKVMADNLADGSKKLDEDLEAVQHNFLFKGYFKRLEKQKRQNADKDSVYKMQQAQVQ